MIDNEIVKEHFFSPRNITPDALPRADMLVMEKGDKSIGDWVRVTYQCNRQEEILYFTYKVFGHPYLIAGLSLYSEKMLGKQLEKLNHVSSLEIIQQFEIPKNKQYLALFLEDVFREMVMFWRGQKNEK